MSDDTTKRYETADEYFESDAFRLKVSELSEREVDEFARVLGLVDRNYVGNLAKLAAHCTAAWIREDYGHLPGDEIAAVLANAGEEWWTDE